MHALHRLLPLAVALSVAACAPTTTVRPPLLVVGVDGGERRVIEALWRRGELPTLRRLAEQGTFLPLATAYGSSPVIWTTIATGVVPEEHGITDFVVATPRGDVPVSSEVRRRPALWNMLDRVGRRTAVLGWWATWPAETVDGIVLTDRLETGLPERVHPPERLADLERWLEAAHAGGHDFGGNAASELRDRVVTLAARESLADACDLVLAYYRSVDLASHDFWHLFAPEDFPDGPPTGARQPASEDPVADAYRAFDAALGDLMAAAPIGTSVLVISDHGFRRELRDSAQLLLDFDRVLEDLGWLERDRDGEIDLATSRAWTHASPTHRKQKLLRLSPGTDVRAAQSALATALTDVRFAGGRRAFDLRSPSAREQGEGADLVVEVLADHAAPTLLRNGRPIERAVLHLGRITGSHGARTRGILLAHGPIFAPGRDGVKVSIHDLAPTILHALGLPVAEDFTGAVAIDLFADELRRRPQRTIASWGRRDAGGARASEEDRRLIEELAALGYLE